MLVLSLLLVACTGDFEEEITFADENLAIADLEDVEGLARIDRSIFVGGTNTVARTPALIRQLYQPDLGVSSEEALSRVWERVEEDGWEVATQSSTRFQSVRREFDGLYFAVEVNIVRSGDSPETIVLLLKTADRP